MPFHARLALVAASIVIVFGLGLPGRSAPGANPSAEQALKLTPIQADVDYDRPTPAEAAKCKIFAKKTDGHVGWVVETADGTILRKFVDTNGDNVVDQWSYYKDGVEVYRENDTTFTGKVDQYRWLNTAGTRWAVENGAKREPGAKAGKNIAWKVISPEEVTAEVVAALAKQDVERFNRLLFRPRNCNRWALGRPRARPWRRSSPRRRAIFGPWRPAPAAITPESKWAAVRRQQSRASCRPTATAPATT